VCGGGDAILTGRTIRSTNTIR